MGRRKKREKRCSNSSKERRGCRPSPYGSREEVIGDEDIEEDEGEEGNIDKEPGTIEDEDDDEEEGDVEDEGGDVDGIGDEGEGKSEGEEGSLSSASMTSLKACTSLVLK